MRRYRFYQLYLIEQSKRVKPDPSDEILPPTQLKLLPQKKALLDEFFRQVQFNIKNVEFNFGPTASQRECLRSVAGALHSLVLFYLAAQLYVSEGIEQAGRVYGYLARTSRKDFGHSSKFMRLIQELDVHCHLIPASFKQDKIPAPDVLSKMRCFAEEVKHYVTCYPLVAVSIARLRYLCGDMRGAETILIAALDAFEEHGRGDRLLLANLHVGLGFLAFIQKRWAKAAAHFRGVIQTRAYRPANWSPLVPFIDYVRSQGTEVTFLQLFYREMAKEIASPELLLAAEAWLNEDSSRQELRWLLRTARTGEIAIPFSGKKAKQRR